MPLSASENEQLRQELAAALEQASATPDARRAVELLVPLHSVDAFVVSPLTPGQSGGVLDLTCIVGGEVVGLTVTRKGISSQIVRIASLQAVELEIDEKKISLLLRQGATRVWRQEFPRAPGTVDIATGFLAKLRSHPSYG